MEGLLLQEVEEEKDLGIVMDKSVKPSKQRVAPVKRANRTLGMIRCFVYKLIKCVKNLYINLVRPQLECAKQE